MVITIESLNYKSEREKLATLRVIHAATKKFHRERGTSPHLPPMADQVKFIDEYERIQTFGFGNAFVAKENGKIIGCLFSRILRSPLLPLLSYVLHLRNLPPKVIAKLESGRHYLLDNMAVHPRFQRRGIGKALVEARVEHAKQLGCKSLCAVTTLDNDVQLANFKKMGFFEIHREEKTPQPVAYFIKKL
ncbi:MAG: GNAT family N-acetyltransferase [Candidatus Micrarchaeota archaeon]